MAKLMRPARSSRRWLRAGSKFSLKCGGDGSNAIPLRFCPGSPEVRRAAAHREKRESEALPKQMNLELGEAGLKAEWLTRATISTINYEGAKHEQGTSAGGHTQGRIHTE